MQENESMSMQSPERNAADDQELRDLLARVEKGERRRRERLLLTTTPIPAAQTAGERLIPYLCATMEACWIGALLLSLALFQPFGSAEPLIPLWSPFLLLWGTLWWTRTLELRDARRTPPLDEFDRVGTGLPGRAFLLIALLPAGLLLGWLSVYAPSFALYDPGWLSALVRDLLLLNAACYHLVVIFICVGLLAWRGSRLARRRHDTQKIRRGLFIGGSLIALAILAQAGQGSVANRSGAALALLLLAALFLYCALLAQALVQAATVRRAHPLGLEGNAGDQERSIFLTLGLFALLLLLLIFSVASFTNASLLTDLQRLFAPLAVAYDWLVALLTQVIVWLVTPIIWALQSLHFHSAPPQISFPQTHLSGKTRASSGAPEALLMVAQILGILLPLLILTVLSWLILRALRRRRVRLYERASSEEIHESLWSWAVFWAQLRSLLRALLGRLFSERRESLTAAHPETHDEKAPPRDMRAIYRALLRTAARRGYPRRENETPLEYGRRLDEQTPLHDPGIASLTEAYVESRYGARQPDEAQTARLRAIWAALQRRWNSMAGAR
jgi:HEPN domain-containing protein